MTGAERSATAWGWQDAGAATDKNLLCAPALSAARVRENWFFTHIHCGPILPDLAEGGNRQVLAVFWRCSLGAGSVAGGGRSGGLSPANHSCSRRHYEQEQRGSITSGNSVCSDLVILSLPPHARTETSAPLLLPGPDLCHWANTHSGPSFLALLTQAETRLQSIRSAGNGRSNVFKNSGSNLGSSHQA